MAQTLDLTLLDDDSRVAIPNMMSSTGSGVLYISGLGVLYEGDPASGNPWVSLFARLTSTGGSFDTPGDPRTSPGCAFRAIGEIAGADDVTILDLTGRDLGESVFGNISSGTTSCWDANGPGSSNLGATDRDPDAAGSAWGQIQGFSFIRRRRYTWAAYAGGGNNRSFAFITDEEMTLAQAQLIKSSYINQAPVKEFNLAPGQVLNAVHFDVRAT